MASSRLRAEDGFAKLPIRQDGFAQLPIRPITDSPNYRFAQMDSPQLDSPNYKFARLQIRPTGFAQLDSPQCQFAAGGFHLFGNEPLGIALVGFDLLGFATLGLLPSGPVRATGIPGLSREQPVLRPGIAASSHDIISVGIYVVFCYQACSRLNMCRRMIPCFFASKSYTHFGQQDTNMEV